MRLGPLGSKILMSNLYDVQSNFVKLAQENLHVQANMWLEAEDYETLNVP